jgi:hypothetical protein
MKRLTTAYLAIALAGIVAISAAADYRTLNVVYWGDSYQTFKDGTVYSVNSTTKDATAVYPVGGVASGYKIARGLADVTSSSTITAATHGLTSVSHIVANLAQDASIDASDVTTTVSGTSIVIKVWKPTSSGNPTPIAATLPRAVSWMAIGS